MDIYFDVLLYSIGFVLIFRTQISYRIVNFALIIFYIVLIMQIVIVGYKWQYVPLYVIIFIITTLQSTNMEIKNKFAKIMYYFLIFLVIGISATLVYILPVPKFDIEDKKYSVGYEEFHVVVSDREQPKAFYELSNLTSTGKRELLVDVYYPSNDQTEVIQLFKDVDTNWGKTVIRYLNRTWGIALPEFLLSHLNLSYFDIGTNLERLDNKSPIVIYTHGWSGEKIFATDQLITIASQGYVVVALDHTGLAMFTELPTGTIYNTGSTENSSKVYDVMYEMSLDIENTINYLENKNYYADFSDISLIGHSTGGGSAHLYCSRNDCNSLILQDPFFVPLLEEVGTIDLVTDSYFIYSEDWYNGYEDINDLNEIEVYRSYVKNKNFAQGFYMTQSAHYDFIAFGAISPLAKYTFLKGRIDYKDSLKANNRFNLESLASKKITTDKIVYEIKE